MVKTKKHEKSYLEDLQRLQAEFENYQKRIETEKESFQKFANEDLIIELLNVLDNFELSLKHCKDKGIGIIYSQLKSILEKNGLKEISAKGKFDPKLHEVLVQEKGKEDDVIIEELQKGYILNDKVIKPSKVKISKLKWEK